ncbi:VOC family protein [Conexibacter sp. JD483]|uniref:VOC family protein n=1 Tax=unclassified Conexibacter TaxID=2627773 RepID=UPI00271EB11C|nr:MULTISPECIES: VOC family protein [unclassified Conexibacter]MDO8186994.1 VOC family protein [Conexibacter sp. CPCC 205706]MDO8200688.1 VOC family protein [Conexibacter sp. CPCC 205762]MDR9371487.1 VOC family protein [Conexibacter sp. JD483]
MSERDHYEHGVPCWVDHASENPQAAADFYAGLLGWECEDVMPPDAPGRYFMARLRGRDVAALSSQPLEGAPPAWNTYVAVASADAAAEAAAGAGGRVLSGPFDVFDSGRMAVLQDPAGAVFSVWQAGRHRGAGIVNEPGTLAWNELTTRDAEGSQAFYTAVFGWRSLPLTMGEGRYFTWHLAGAGEPDQQSAIGGLMPMDGDMWPSDLPPHWMSYFAVADADAAAERTSELGGLVSIAPFDTPAGRIAVINDPVGAVASLIQLP